MYTTASELLQAVYDDLKVPGRRCKGDAARTRTGRGVQPLHKYARSWCTAGKVQHLMNGDLWLGFVDDAIDALDATKPITSGTIPTNNDDLDDEQWAAWMEAAIQYAKAQEAVG